MENYDLEKDEVVLYKGNVSLPKEKGLTQLILTNINFVLITRKKKLFSKEQVNVDIYPVNEIKYYKDIPQVIKNGYNVELYLLDDEVSFEFDSKNEVRKFVNATMTLLTNKSTLERNTKKIKDTISTINNGLGIDSIGIAKNVLKNGIVGKTTNVIGKGVKTISKIIKKEKTD